MESCETFVTGIEITALKFCGYFRRIHSLMYLLNIMLGSCIKRHAN